MNLKKQNTYESTRRKNGSETKELLSGHFCYETVVVEDGEDLYWCIHHFFVCHPFFEKLFVNAVAVDVADVGVVGVAVDVTDVGVVGVAVVAVGGGVVCTVVFVVGSVVCTVVVASGVVVVGGGGAIIVVACAFVGLFVI